MLSYNALCFIDLHLRTNVNAWLILQVWSCKRLCDSGFKW